MKKIIVLLLLAVLCIWTVGCDTNIEVTETPSHHESVQSTVQAETVQKETPQTTIKYSVLTPGKNAFVTYCNEDTGEATISVTCQYCGQVIETINIDLSKKSEWNSSNCLTLSGTSKCYNKSCADNQKYPSAASYKKFAPTSYSISAKKTSISTENTIVDEFEPVVETPHQAESELPYFSTKIAIDNGKLLSLVRHKLIPEIYENPNYEGFWDEGSSTSVNDSIKYNYDVLIVQPDDFGAISDGIQNYIDDGVFIFIIGTDIPDEYAGNNTCLILLGSTATNEGIAETILIEIKAMLNGESIPSNIIVSE